MSGTCFLLSSTANRGEHPNWAWGPRCDKGSSPKIEVEIDEDKIEINLENDGVKFEIEIEIRETEFDLNRREKLMFMLP